MKIMLIILSMTGLVGCVSQYEYVPYTIQLQTRTGISNDDLRKVQFYNDIEIVLYRIIDHSKADLSAGDINMVNGNWMEKIVIKPLTPGVLLDINEKNQLFVSFEDGPERYLVFGQDADYPDRFSIYGRNWQNNSATITYDRKIYRLSPESAPVNLLVNYKHLKSWKVFTRTASGRIIDPETK